MPEVDALIFAHLGEILLVGGVEVPGMFHRQPREIQLNNGSIVGLEISFDCQINATVKALAKNAVVSIKGKPETYRFVRRVPPDGDESGLVILELGTP